MEVTGIHVSTKYDGIKVFDGSKPFYMLNATSARTAKLNFRKEIKKLKLQYVAEQHALVEYAEWCKTEEAKLCSKS
jgi:hypothetical protein